MWSQNDLSSDFFDDEYDDSSSDFFDDEDDDDLAPGDDEFPPWDDDFPPGDDDDDDDLLPDFDVGTGGGGVLGGIGDGGEGPTGGGIGDGGDGPTGGGFGDDGGNGGEAGGPEGGGGDGGVGGAGAVCDNERKCGDDKFFLNDCDKFRGITIHANKQIFKNKRQKFIIFDCCIFWIWFK